MSVSIFRIAPNALGTGNEIAVFRPQYRLLAACGVCTLSSIGSVRLDSMMKEHYHDNT
jgi:hypothetical protein